MVLDGVTFRLVLVVLGEVDDALCSWSRSCCPDCSDVVVEGRVNEEDDVLVMHADERATKVCNS